MLFFIALGISYMFGNINDFKVATWNLQGSWANTESKWSVSVRRLLDPDVPIERRFGILPCSLDFDFFIDTTKFFLHSLTYKSCSIRG